MGASLSDWPGDFEGVQASGVANLGARGGGVTGGGVAGGRVAGGRVSMTTFVLAQSVLWATGRLLMVSKSSAFSSTLWDLGVASQVRWWQRCPRCPGGFQELSRKCPGGLQEVSRSCLGGLTCHHYSSHAPLP